MLLQSITPIVQPTIESYPSYKGTKLNKSGQVNTEKPFIPRQNTSPEKWWKSLDKHWKLLFAESYDIKKITQVQKALTLTDLVIGPDSKIKNLEPMRAMKHLTEFKCLAPDIFDLSVLSGSKTLTDIHISSKCITDITPLSKLANLRSLDLSNTSVKSILPIENLIFLENLLLKNTPVNDISILRKFKKLKNVDISNTRVIDLDPLNYSFNLTALNISGTPVSSFPTISLSGKLHTFNASQTALNNLASLKACKNIYSLDCKNTLVSFEEILHYIAKRIKEQGELTGFELISNYSSGKAFVAAIENIRFSISGLEDAIVFWANDVLELLIAVNTEPENRLAIKLIKLLACLPLQNTSSALLQKLAINALRLILKGNKDTGLEQQIFTSLVPLNITNCHLAFYLAAYYAIKNDKQKLFEYTFLALKKGRSGSSFKNEKHFFTFLNDKDFIALINNPPIPDPEKNPLAWYNSLPAGLKKILEYDLPEISERGVKLLLLKEDFELLYDNAKCLDALKSWKGLKKLVLRECQAASLEALASLNGLEKLECIKHKHLQGMQYADVSALAGLHNLKQIVLQGHSIKNIHSLANLIKLEELNLLGNSIESPEPLKVLLNLKSLRISFMQGILLNTSFLSGLKQLSELNISSSGDFLTVISLDELADLKSLKTLRIENIRAAGKQPVSLQPLSGLTSLEKLFLGSSSFLSIEPLFNLTSLKEISIADVNKTNNLKKDIKNHMPWCKLI